MSIPVPMSAPLSIVLPVMSMFHDQVVVGERLDGLGAQAQEQAVRDVDVRRRSAAARAEAAELEPVLAVEVGGAARGDGLRIAQDEAVDRQRQSDVGVNDVDAVGLGERDFASRDRTRAGQVLELHAAFVQLVTGAGDGAAGEHEIGNVDARDAVLDHRADEMNVSERRPVDDVHVDGAVAGR
jgi:hypothetical protein